MIQRSDREPEARAEYPPRPTHYAHKLTRLLFKSCACQEIGANAVLLVIHIAHTEDAARYQYPVRFWNGQLMALFGWSSPKQLNDARRKAVEAGWLHYEREGTRQVGRYWTLIPSHVEAFADTPIEQCPIHSENGTNTGTNGLIHSENGTNTGTNPGTNSGKHSNPNPNPIKSARAPRFVPPTIDELREYCHTANIEIDAQRFIDHYTANGWRVGKSSMKDWKAAVRNWARNDFGNKGNGKPQPESIYKPMPELR